MTVTPVFLALVARVAGLAAAAAPAEPAWPAKPVKILFGFPPASATDVVARAVGQKLSEKWRQPGGIENPPGAGGNLGSEMAAPAPADGYTLFFCTVAHAVSASLDTKLNYDYLQDFTPL